MMKQIIFKIQLITIVVFCFYQGFSQTKDTLVDVGHYKLNFTIIEGNGIPILFESGSGNDGTVWRNIAHQVAEITGTTVITYDRAGMGKSIIKPDNLGFEKNGIIDGIEALEVGLKKLGFDKEIILVAHSFGGFYTSLFSTRNEEKVKHVIFVDASISSFYTEAFMEKLNKMITESFLNQLKEEKLGVYYEIKNFENTLKLIGETNFPMSVSVTDLVASEPYNPFKSDTDKNRWITEHQKFAKASLNREFFMVNGASHYTFKTNPNLVIYQIVKAYTNNLIDSKNKEILMRTLNFSIKTVNEIID